MKEKKRGLFPFLPPFPSSHRPPRAFYFSMIAIFIVIPSGSLCEGETLCAVLLPQKRRERESLPKLLDSWTSGFATYEYIFVMMHQRSNALTYGVKRRIFSNAKLSFAKLTLSVSH